LDKVGKNWRGKSSRGTIANHKKKKGRRKKIVYMDQNKWVTKYKKEQSHPEQEEMDRC